MSSCKLPSPSDIQGLSNAEAERRKRAGQANVPPKEATRTVRRIVAVNCLTLFNFVNLSLAVLISIFGDLRHTLFLWVAVISTCIAIAQEIRAKITIDKLSILRKSNVQAVRDGSLLSIEAHNIVLGDVLLLQHGDQIMADGVCSFSLGIQVNESLITGEADDVPKSAGDAVWSGSFVTSGSAYVQITAVGKDSFASRISSEAKEEKRKKSRIMFALRKIIKILAIMIFPVGIALFARDMHSGQSLEAAVTGTAAALVGMIPQGLILLTNIAFAVGVVNLGKRKILVQSLSCIEALARVDILCLDKTGTITTGELALGGVVPLDGHAQTDITHKLSKLLSALPDSNATSSVLRANFPWDGIPYPEPVSFMPFSSSRKYSSVDFSDETIILGAPSAVLPGCQFLDQADDLARSGSRVLLLAGAEQSAQIRPYAFILLEDAIRPEAKSSFGYFDGQGVEIKIISGDNTSAVSAIAERAGINNFKNCLDLSGYASGPGHKPGEGHNAITPGDVQNTVFGRASPYQKRTLIRLIQAGGHSAAMTGDGVNDVLALKEADCGVAMANGSEASRSVADLVLLTSDFSAMIPAVNEGRRVINNIQKVAPLYLSKTVFSSILAIAFIFLPCAYPFTPIQLTLISTLTIGIPSFFLTLRPNYRPISGDLLCNVVTGALPTGTTVAALVLLVNAAGNRFGLRYEDISTVCAFLTGAMGFGLVFRMSKPFDMVRSSVFIGSAAAFIAAFLFAPDVLGFSNILSFSGLAALFLLPIGIITASALRRFADTFYRQSDCS